MARIGSEVAPQTRETTPVRPALNNFLPAWAIKLSVGIQRLGWWFTRNTFCKFARRARACRRAGPTCCAGPLNKQRCADIAEIREGFFASSKARGHTAEKIEEGWGFVTGFYRLRFLQGVFDGVWRRSASTGGGLNPINHGPFTDSVGAPQCRLYYVNIHLRQAAARSG
jgi:hypothetical protein